MLNTNRRAFLGGLTVIPGLMPCSFCIAAEPLKISHQFPGGSDKEGDFRHRLCARFAQELDKRSNGALKANVYPGSSLMKVNAHSAQRKGALDMTLIPLPYAGGEIPEPNIALMPGLVTSYEQDTRGRKPKSARR